MHGACDHCACASNAFSFGAANQRATSMPSRRRTALTGRSTEASRCGCYSSLRLLQSSLCVTLTTIIFKLKWFMTAVHKKVLYKELPGPPQYTNKCYGVELISYASARPDRSSDEEHDDDGGVIRCPVPKAAGRLVCAVLEQLWDDVAVSALRCDLARELAKGRRVRLR